MLYLCNVIVLINRQKSITKYSAIKFFYRIMRIAKRKFPHMHFRLWRQKENIYETVAWLMFIWFFFYGSKDEERLIGTKLHLYTSKSLRVLLHCRVSTENNIAL